jgi:hypothetical protein
MANALTTSCLFISSSQLSKGVSSSGILFRPEDQGPNNRSRAFRPFAQGLDLCTVLNDFPVAFGSVADVMNAAVTGRAREILSALGADGMDEV